MTKTTDKPTIPRKTGMTHGVAAYVNTGRLPSGRAYRRAMKEVSVTRGRLIAKYGGDKIEPDVLALVDSAAKAMMVQELCSLYIKRAGILRQDSLIQGNLELHSVLAKSYASYANLTRLNLEAAARLADRKQPDITPDIVTWAEEFDAQKAAQEAQAGPVCGVAASADGPECPKTGEGEGENGLSREECEKRRSRKPVEPRSPEGPGSDAGEEGLS
jgi:hypothetical protein